MSVSMKRARSNLPCAAEIVVTIHEGTRDSSPLFVVEFMA